MEKAFELCTSPQSLIVRNPEQSIVFYSPLANSEVDELNYATFWFISQLRPKDFILLPRSHSSRSLWEHYKKLFNYKENQAVWYNLPKNLESMTSDFHVENLIFFKNKNVIVVPFTLQEVVLNACKAVGIEAFGDLTCNAPDKRWLHPTVPDSDTHYEFPIKFPNGVKTPKGYTCYSENDLRRAKKLLNLEKCVIKSASGMGGYDIFFVKSEKDFEQILSKINFKHNKYPGVANVNYDNLEPAYLFEELIDLKFDDKDFSSSPTVTFFGDKFLGFTRQKLKGTRFIGASSEPFPEEVLQKVKEMSYLMATAVPKFNSGCWCLDFLVDKNNEVYVSDLNLGRFNGSSLCLNFVLSYAFGKSFLTLLFPRSDVITLNTYLLEKSILFDFQAKKGALALLISNKTMFFICIGDSEQECKKLKEIILNEFRKKPLGNL